MHAACIVSVCTYLTCLAFKLKCYGKQQAEGYCRILYVSFNGRRKKRIVISDSVVCLCFLLWSFVSVPGCLLYLIGINDHKLTLFRNHFRKLENFTLRKFPNKGNFWRKFPHKGNFHWKKILITSTGRKLPSAISFRWKSWMENKPYPKFLISFQWKFFGS